MPFTLNLSSTPLGLAAPAAYAVVRGVSGSVDSSNQLTANVAIYATQAAYEAGDNPLQVENIVVPMPSDFLSQIEASISAPLIALPNATAVSQVQTVIATPISAGVSLEGT